MTRKVGQSANTKLTLAASATLLAVALPSSVFAIGALADEAEADMHQFVFTPAAADPDIAELVARTGAGQSEMTRFTPASAAAVGTERSVTAAIRVDQQTAQALSTADRPANAGSNGNAPGLRIAPIRYNLGVARGYDSFVPAPAAAASPRLTASAAPALSRSLTDANLPDITSFAPRRAGEEDSRFAARVAMEESPSMTSQDAQNSVSDQMLDVSGSFRLTRNLDITAGVRVEQDRDIVPLPDVDQQDSQAVYIGTQFRF